MNKPFSCTALLVVVLMLHPLVGLCTDPADTTVIRKQAGTWSLPYSLWQGLSIDKVDLGTTVTISLRDLFSQEEYRDNVGRSTAGPYWSGNSIFFILDYAGQSLFYRNQYRGKRVLINLESGEIYSNLTRFDRHLDAAEASHIRQVLHHTAVALREKKRNVYADDHVDGAMLLAVQRSMPEVRADLEAIEKYSTRNTRKLSKNCLRLLGFPPQGYVDHLPHYGVGARLSDPLVMTEESRLSALAKLWAAIPSEAVYGIMGPPDYRVVAEVAEKGVDRDQWRRKWPGAWRYDFGPDNDSSLLLIWDQDGMLSSIEKVVPGLWHGHALFKERLGRKTDQLLYGFNYISLYSDDFKGVIEKVPLPAYATVQGEPRSRPIQIRQEPAATAVRPIEEGPDMVIIPPGSYVMGSPEVVPASSEVAYLCEYPAHSVTISKPFAVGKTEVSYQDWERCVRDGFCLQVDSRYRFAEDSPVPVSWLAAKAYIQWLNRLVASKTGREGRYRLLSEAEWEYAARAGTVTSYGFAGEIDQNKANYGSTHSQGRCLQGTDCRGKTVAVGSLPANRWGLHEMHGNLAEWVEDCYHQTYDQAPQDGGAWEGGNHGDCRKRMVRGGSWLQEASALRSRSRDAASYDARYYIVGFRLAMDL